MSWELAMGIEQYRGALRAVDSVERVLANEWPTEEVAAALGPEPGRLLADPDPERRAIAAIVLRGSDEPRLVQAARLALRELVQGSLAARHAGLRAAAILGSPTLAPRFLGLLQDADPETRRLTLLVLLAASPARLLAPGFLAGQIRPLLADPDAGVRETARAVLAIITGAEEGVGDAGTTGS